MHCANCGVIFGDDTPAVTKILNSRPSSTNKGEQSTTSPTETDVETETAKITTDEDSPTPKEISVAEALSVIFEIPPLTSELTDEILNNSKIFPRHNHSRNENGDESVETVDSKLLSICMGCAEILTQLYNSFREFTQICKLECEIANRLNQLELLRQEGTKSNSSLTPTPALPVIKKKRGRPRKDPNASVATLTPTPAKKQKIEDSDDESVIISRVVGNNEVIKTELKSELESEMEMEPLHDKDDGVSMSPPDSPVHLDLNEPPRRSPRPVRRSTARNIDWSRLYKNESSDEEEEDGNDKTTAGKEGEGDVDKSGTEMMTETEAENEEQTDASESHFEMDEDEENDPLAIEEDDEDEEYRPDSDLEDLKSATKVGRKRAPYKKKLGTNKSGNKVGRPKKSTPLTKSQSQKRNSKRSEMSCNMCDKQFKYPASLKHHRKVFHGEGLSIRTLQNELENTFDFIQQFECPICQLPFTKTRIQNHVNEHEIDTPWKCDKAKCDKTFAFFTDYRTHRQTHESDRERCEICKIEFRNDDFLAKHQINVHHVRNDKSVDGYKSENDADDEEQAEQKFQCPECDKSYRKQTRLKEHLIVHGIGDKWKCIVCEREFNHQRTFSRHMFLHSKQNPFKCPEEGCAKGYARRDHLERHLQHAHATVLPDSHIPEEVEIMTLITGTRRHRKEREVPCPHCGKMVKRERLRLHLVSHTGERKHVCGECGAKFGLRTTLLTHIKCVHKGLRRYQCQFCEQAFKRSNHLKDHEKLHTEADYKPHACTICDRSFRLEKNLKSHIVSHMGNKDFMCEQCGRSFSRIDNMRQHVKAVHEGIPIRKKRPPSVKKSRPSRKPKTEDEHEEADETENIEMERYESGEAGITLVLAGSSSRTGSMAEQNSSVIVSNKKPARKRVRTKKKVVEQAQEPSLHNSGEQQESIPEGTIMTLSIDPESGNMIPTDLGTVQIHQGEVQEGYEEQRATILQLAPGQVYTASQDGDGVTYYQYTYYQP